MKRIALLLAASILAPSHAFAVDIPLTCANRKSLELRISNVIKGCESSEVSLGEGPIVYSLTAPRSLNNTLEWRFKAAKVAAQAEGISLEITSGYRSVKRQTFLYEQAVKKYGSAKEAAKWVAPPDVSHHPMGLALDINYPQDPKSTKWLEINGYKFGLCRTFKNEWWHFEGNIAPGWKCPKMLKDATELVKP